MSIIDPTQSDGAIGTDAAFEKVLQSSDFFKEAADGVPELDDQATEEASTDEPEELEEVETESDDDDIVDEEAEEEDEETSDEEETEEETTDDPVGDILDPAEYDLDNLLVSVKIDGEERTVSVNDVIKGYSTEQYKGAKGREFGEERKKFESEKATYNQEISALAAAASEQLMANEKYWEGQYVSIEKERETARDDGDTYAASELKDKLGEAQEQYWNARKQRETITSNAKAKQDGIDQAMISKGVEHFNATIHEHISDWDDSVAAAVRTFALEEGLPESLLNVVTDPAIIKFVDGYRRMKTNVSTGAKKRAKVVTKKAPPKKGQSSRQKDQTRKLSTRNKVLSGNGDASDEQDFLRSIAARSLGERE